MKRSPGTIGVCWAIAIACLWLCGSWSALAVPTELPLAARSPSAPSWSYHADTGPEHWAALDPSFATCGSGRAQSPIDLSAAEPGDLANPIFYYQSVPLNLLNNGHTVQVPYAPGSYLTLDGKQYNLLQFHFHSPSEHTLDGQHQAAELHLVHQSEAGELAVIAVLLQAGETAEATSSYSRLSQSFPRKAGDKIRTGSTIDATTLLPATTATYRYSGSLTTPPCTESVTWLVMTAPVTLPAAQLAQYEKLLNRNNRPLQRLNHRSVQVDRSP